MTLPLDDASWRTSDFNRFGVQLLWVRNNNGPSIVARARIPVMVLTVFLGVLVYLWTYELYGWTGAVLALSLLCFDPNILANGGLATNDLGMACFTCLAAYAFWRMLVKPGWGRATLAGIALGLALTAKFSAIFLLAALPVMALATWWLSPKERRTTKQLKALALLTPWVVGAAFLTLWTVYGFQIHYDPVTGFPVPAQAYLDGLRLSKATVFGGSPTFLLGMYSTTGWWYYFPVALFVKTPLPTLILVACAVVYAIRERDWKRSAVLLVPVVIYFALAMLSPLEIGYRHLLPILPFLFVFTGQLANKPLRVNWFKWAVPALVALLVIGT
ncbi:MAG: ArnT family glycosyltransferase, partial [Blastocatellia bacterium]